MRVFLAILLLFTVRWNSSTEFLKVWESTWDSGWRDEVRAMALDASGNTYISGRTQTNASSVVNALSLVKFSDEGRVSWDLRLSDVWQFAASDVAIDPVGNVLLTGQFHSHDGSLRGELLEFDPNGEQLWKRGGVDSPFSISLDPPGNVYPSAKKVTKVSSAGETLWEAPLSASDVAIDDQMNVVVWGAFGLAKLSASGEVLWTVTNSPVNALKISRSGYIYAGSSTNSSFSEDAFVVAKFSPDGNLQWRQTYEGTRLTHHSQPYDLLTPLVVDSQENVYAIGSMKREDGLGVNYAILKYDQAGNYLWRTTVRPARASNSAIGSELFLDSHENVYFAVTTRGEPFDHSTVVKVDVNGAVRGTIELSELAGPPLIQLDASDHLFLGTTTINFDVRLVNYSQAENPNAPRVVEPLKDQIVSEGREFQLSVRLESASLVQYQWLKNGSLIPGATNSTLSISSVSLQDEGAYAVNISNSGGSIFSSEAQLTVITLPRFGQSAVQKTTILNGSVSLSGEAYSTWPVDYSWSHNGRHLAGEAGAVLYLSNAQPADAGDYSVIASTPAGTVEHRNRVAVFTGAREKWRLPVGEYGAPGPDIAADPSSNILLARRGAQPTLSKLRSTGNVLWEQALAGSSGIAVDSDGHIFTAGQGNACTTRTFPGGSETTCDFFLVLQRFAPDGTLTWTHTNRFLDYAQQIKVSGTRALIIGMHQNFSPAILCYDSEGTEIWTNSLGMTELYANALQVDPQGNAYVCGTVGPPELRELVLQKFSRDGALLWERHYEPLSRSSQFPAGLAIAEDAIYLVGYQALNGSFVFKISPAGDLLWSYKNLVPWTTFDAQLDPDGNLVIAGGAGALADARLVLTKLSAAGDEVWTSSTHRNGNSAAFGELAIDRHGDILIAEIFGCAKWDRNGLLRWRIDDFIGAQIVVTGDSIYSTGFAVSPNGLSPTLIAIQQIDSPPVPAMRLVDKAIAIAEPAVLELMIANPELFTYSWTLNGAPIPGATNNLYAIDHLTTTNLGTYGVTVSDSGGMRAWPTARLEAIEVIEVTESFVAEAERFVIEFQSIPGAAYRLETSADLRSWTAENSLIATSETNRFSSLLTSSPRLFFRIVRP